ncbi:MAG TPA: response regulator [Candidatus Saccharimonadales bacterium]|nr:response regulator [Candidatus Saccharimonadales bacterium]
MSTPALRPHILLAEDSEDDVLLFQYAMRKAGVETAFSVLETTQGVMDYVEGKGIYGQREIYPLPAIIFLDGQLHNKSSTALLSWIRNHPTTNEVPVVVLTGHLDAEVTAEAMKCGALTCIAKPMAREHWEQLRPFLK